MTAKGGDAVTVLRWPHSEESWIVRLPPYRIPVVVSVWQFPGAEPVWVCDCRCEWQPCAHVLVAQRAARAQEIVPT